MFLSSGRHLDLEQARVADGQGGEVGCSRVKGCQDGRRKEKEISHVNFFSPETQTKVLLPWSKK